MTNEMDLSKIPETDWHFRVHAPNRRADAVPSSRHVQALVGGEVVADSHRPVLVFETGYATRYYLPIEDINQDVLLPSKKETHCPYKGIANYYLCENW